MPNKPIYNVDTKGLPDSFERNPSVGYFSEGGTFPVPGDYQGTTIRRNILNQHPWETDLRVMGKMLNREIQLPHVFYIDGVPRRNHCERCYKAYLLREKYEKQRAIEELSAHNLPA